jgi:alpha-amylase/alpha-mannosidase (GH57 family)
MKKKPAASGKPVPEIVSSILGGARDRRTDGPSSPLYGERAQLSSAITQAGTLLARLDRGGEAPRRQSVLESLLGPLTQASGERKTRRTWFFASASSPGEMPNAKRIEQLLKQSAKEGTRLVFDAAAKPAAGQPDDVHCVLPEGAEDPVCEPRK